MIKQVYGLIAAGLLVASFYSCGGPESYKTPIVNSGDVIQSECKKYDDSKLLEETFEAKVVGGDIVMTHSNILVPENTVMGIMDVDGNLTYDGKFNYYYLEAGEQFISLQEKFRYSSSSTNCYYTLKVKISNVSGGIYDFMLFDDNGRLSYSREIRVR